MLSIIENIKKIEEENVKEVISLTNENIALKKRIKALENDLKGVEKRAEDAYQKGFINALSQLKDIAKKYLESEKIINFDSDK